MPGHTTVWPRPFYERPGGQPFLFYVVFGVFDSGYEVGSEYRTLGVHPGLRLNLYSRQDHADVLSGFQAGYLWDELAAQEPALARRVSESDQCLILRGELEDRADLNCLRDSVGLLTFFLDHGGVCVYDPQMFRWWEPAAWRRQVFEPSGPVPRQHVVILTSDEDESGAPDKPRTWFHTRGMRKFGRPDLSVHDVPPPYHEAVIDLFERFIEFQALGGIIADGPGSVTATASRRSTTMAVTEGRSIFLGTTAKGLAASCWSPTASTSPSTGRDRPGGWTPG